MLLFKTQDWTDGKEGSWGAVCLGDLREADVITTLHSKETPMMNWKRNLSR